MAVNPHFRPYIVDENGNTVLEIPRSSATVFYSYETRIVDRMPVLRQPHPKSTLEKLKDALKAPRDLLRVPTDRMKGHNVRPASWGGPPSREGRYYHVDQYGRVVETRVTRVYRPQASSPPSGNSGFMSNVAKDKNVAAYAAEHVNNAALFARMGSGGAPGSSGASGSGGTGQSLPSSGMSAGPSSGTGTFETSGGSSGLGSGGGLSSLFAF